MDIVWLLNLKERCGEYPKRSDGTQLLHVGRDNVDRIMRNECIGICLKEWVKGKRNALDVGMIVGFGEWEKSLMTRYTLFATIDKRYEKSEGYVWTITGAKFKNCFDVPLLLSLPHDSNIFRFHISDITFFIFLN